MLLASASVASSGFTIPSPPTSSTASRVPLSVAFSSGPTGLDPYRASPFVVLDGLYYTANGYDPPTRWDGGSNYYDIGSTAPTSFSVADSASGSTHTSGTTLDYYLVFRNSTTGKETAPQGAGVSHTMSATKDVDITWTDPGGEFDVARIYRRLAGSDNYKLVAEVAAATATYTDGTADSGLTTAEAYVTTYRATKPPVFDWLASYQGRLFGGFRDDPAVHYSQEIRADDELRCEDFPDGWIVQPGAEDGTGGVVTMLPHYGSAFFFKRRACYQLTGSDQSTWSIRRLSADRGCISRRCIVEIEGSALILDERGLYYWSPSGEAIVAGAPANTRESPLQPTFDRMNLGAADQFYAVHDRENRVVVFWVALDYEPIANTPIVFDYGANRFVGKDSARWGSAGGYLEDASGLQHLCRGCDMGYLWEEDYAESEGVFAGDNTATLTDGSLAALTASGASFDTTIASGAPGVPYERYDSSGTFVELNRVYAASSTVLTPYLYPASTPVATDSVAIGVIPAVARTPRMTLNTPEWKWVRAVIVEHDNGVSGNLRLDSAKNEDSFSLVAEIDTTSEIRTTRKASDRGWTWGVQLSQRYANLGFSVRGVHVQYLVVPGRR